MRYPLMIVMAVLVLSACTPTVQFSEPMPPGRLNLPNIPKAMRGEIVDSDRGGDSWLMGKDTLWAGEEYWVNGEDFVLRRMAGHIVMSKRVAETGFWEVIPIRRTQDSMYLCQFDDDSDRLQRISAILEVAPETRVSEGTPGYEYSLLSPSAKGFRALLHERLYAEEEGGMLLPKGAVIRP